MDAMGNNELLSSELKGLSTQTQFPNSGLANSFATVSKLIATRETRGVDVDTFYIETGGKKRVDFLLGCASNIYALILII